ncbi:MAG: hypothetical protein HYW51_02325 [Candidatus Doudnabacteria bacterium]|nr:hypothetical protein [Candidatus Doudnabacteria bacterium]
MPVEISAKLMRSRKKDKHEADLDHQKRARKRALKILQSDKSWNRIQCVVNGKLLSKQAIGQKIWQLTK